jgi:hypothetical protein
MTDDMTPAEPDATARTGNPHVDSVLDRLAAVADAPPPDQVAPLADADRALRETLDSIGDV